MTYRIIGDEFDPECETVDLTDAAYRLHSTMLGWSVNQLLDGAITPADIRRAMPPRDYSVATSELVAVGFWTTSPKGWQLVHHLDRQITAATLTLKRNNGARRQAKFRQSKAQEAANSDEKVESKTVPLTADLPEPSQAKPSQGNASTNGVSNGVSNGVTDDPWAKPSEDTA